ncbi:apoptotic protease-activating factor 1 isoform X2 [Drosophila tropicalis]|uniref:apoptotic protease-activating factor 1 isoform X2 n=1 Tax=Drosophila tropicalis TaxID=46794 RepID=UPI0035AB93E2
MNAYRYKDILLVFFENFEADFECKDVEEMLRNILTSREVDKILIAEDKTQVDVLFEILNDKPEETVARFINELSATVHDINYEFLKNPIKEEYRQPTPETIIYITERDKLFSNNQLFAQYNVSRFEPYLRLKKALMELRPARNVLVHGQLGSGKQWLVLDVCSSYAVQRKMGFKIIWLNLKRCHTPESDLEMLQSLMHQIDPQWNSQNSQYDNSRSADPSIRQRIESAKTELRHILQSKVYKNCLLVLRNVQNLNTWKAFNLGCKILITTRNKSISNYLSSATTTHVPLDDSLTASEVESLFLKYLDCPPEDLPSARDIKTTNPRKLSIIAETLHDGLATLDTWKHVNCDKLSTIIESSLSVLEPIYRQMYEKLFIFPESAQIPIRLLTLLWSQSHNNSTHEDPMAIVNKLQGYSLIEKQSQSKPPTITIPSIYFELNPQLDNKTALHKKIVDSYNIIGNFVDQNDLTIPNLDNYFYTHIGHHLMAIEHTESVKLLRIIFIDFRFLEQKIRHDTTSWNASGSILNTLQQIKLYKQRIIDDDPTYSRLVNSLLDFLPRIEENLIRSKYTCLLRVAMMAEEGAIYEEANRQIQRFPDYLWFTEHGRFHQQRQIINLGPDQAQHAIYLNDDFCLMALSNKQLLLTDVSLEGTATYVYGDDKDTSDITRMAIFNNQKHLLTLHGNGSLKLWSLWPVLESDKHTSTRKYKQLVNGVVRRSLASNAEQIISAFYLEEETGIGHTSIQLHVAFNNGDICICDWNPAEEEFKSLHTPPLKTEQLRVRCFVKVLKRFYVLCTAKCIISIWDLRNSSRELTELEGYNPDVNDSPHFMDVLAEDKDRRFNEGISGTMLLLVFKHSVWRLKFDKDGISKAYAELLKLPDSGFITCGKRSSDGHYLILGTSEGLIVYDLRKSEVSLRCNVSENISCVDIYELCDPIFKYIILCGAVGKHILHVHTLRIGGDQEITWLHNVDEDDLKEFSAGSGACLRSIMDMNSERTQLFAIDSKNGIHQIQPAADGKTATISSRSTTSTSQAADSLKITAICAHTRDQIFVAYSDGTIIDINRDVKLPQQYINEGIDFLKQVNTQFLVASARESKKTVIFKITGTESPSTSSSNQWPLSVPLDTMEAHVFDEHYLLLFSEYVVGHIDLLSPNCLFDAPTEDQIVGFDLKNRLLFLALKDHMIKVFYMYNNGSKLTYEERCLEKLKPQNVSICFLTVSNDASLLALGFRNGNIEVFSFGKDNKIQLIYSITEGHNEPIRQLQFSPCNLVLTKSTA